MIGGAFPPLAALATQPILAQSLGVDGRGTVAAAVAPLLLATSVATLGLPEALTYRIARNRSTMGSGLLKSAGFALVSSVAAVFAILLFSPWLSGGDEALAALMVVASLAVVPSILVALTRGAAAGLQEWRLVAIEKAISSGLRLVVICTLAVVDHLTVFSAALVLAFTPCIGGVIYLLIGVRARGLPVPAEKESARAMQLLGFGSRVWIGSMSGILLMRLDQTIMVPLSGSYELGLYVVAVSISEVPLIINAAMRDVSFSSEAARFDPHRLVRASRVSSVGVGLISIAIAGTMWAWLPLLFGEDFRPAVSVALILLLAVALGNPGSIAGAGLSAVGRPGLRSISLLIACLLNVGLMILLVPALGATGAALSTLGSNLLASNLNILFLRRIGGPAVLDFYRFRRADLSVFANTLKNALRRPGGKK